MNASAAHRVARTRRERKAGRPHASRERRSAMRAAAPEMRGDFRGDGGQAWRAPWPRVATRLHAGARERAGRERGVFRGALPAKPSLRSQMCPRAVASIPSKLLSAVPFWEGFREVFAPFRDGAPRAVARRNPSEMSAPAGLGGSLRSRWGVRLPRRVDVSYRGGGAPEANTISADFRSPG
jgi:hypothetical protein